MIELKEQYPFKDEEGNEDNGLIMHWAEDAQGQRYYILQLETNTLYAIAIDAYPCMYTYTPTTIKVEEESGGENEENEEQEEQN